MTRLERILDGIGVADDATGPIRARLKRRHLGRGPSDEDVRFCAGMLRSAAATLEGALTLPIEEPGRRPAEDLTETAPGPAPPPPDGELWFQRGAMA